MPQQSLFYRHSHWRQYAFLVSRCVLFVSEYSQEGIWMQKNIEISKWFETRSNIPQLKNITGEIRVLRTPVNQMIFFNQGMFKFKQFRASQLFWWFDHHVLCTVYFRITAPCTVVRSFWKSCRELEFDYKKYNSCKMKEFLDHLIHLSNFWTTQVEKAVPFFGKEKCDCGILNRRGSWESSRIRIQSLGK